MLGLTIKLIEEIAENSSLIVIELINNSKWIHNHIQLVKATAYTTLVRLGSVVLSKNL